MMNMNLPKGKKLILFDGVCNLCNTTVQYVIKHDKKDVFRFTALQSNLGKKIVEAFEIDPTKTDSILLYSEEYGIKSKSSAALHIARQLSFPNNLMTVFFIVPPIIRNKIYDYIAKNRYKWYGKKEYCIMPTKALKAKFLE